MIIRILAFIYVQACLRIQPLLQQKHEITIAWELVFMQDKGCSCKMCSPLEDTESLAWDAVPCVPFQGHAGRLQGTAPALARHVHSNPYPIIGLQGNGYLLAFVISCSALQDHTRIWGFC